MATRTRIVLALALLTAALCAPQAASAAGWIGAASVSVGAAPANVRLVSDAAGNEAVLWVEKNTNFSVKVAYRPAGGTWGAPQTLDNQSSTQPRADLAVDPNGNFIAFYGETITGVGSNFYSAYLPAGASVFGAPQQFNTSTLSGAVVPTGLAVAMGPDGTAWAMVGIQGATGIAGSRPAGPGSSWTLRTNGLPTDSTANLDLTVTADGVPTIADYPGTVGAPRFTRWNGTTWVTLTSTPGTPTGNATGVIAIAPDVNNQTTAIYQISSTVTQLAAQVCPAGFGACSPRTPVEPSNSQNTVSPALATDGSGNAAAVWVENSSVMASRRNGPSATWSAPAPVATGSNPVLAFDANGSLISLHTEASNQIFFQTAAVGSLPQAGVVSVASDPAWVVPAVATDAGGDAFGAWIAATGAGIQTAVYDAQPPSAPVLSAAGPAVAGQAVPFTASATDTWGAVTYAWDYGDGSTDTGPSTSHTYAAPGDYVARVTATDAAGNSSSQSQTISVAAPPSPATPGLAPPVLGESINVFVIKDPVFFKLPGEKVFRRLVKQAHLPNGTIIDTRKGRVLVVVDNGAGGTDSAQFYEGLFEVNQPKSLKGLANIFLNGGGFKGCPKAPKDPHAQLSRKASKPSPHRSVRHLWGSGTGKFRTVGRFAAATVRGTQWLTDDRCDGTLVRVKKGKVSVRDFVKLKTVALPAPKTYFARATRKR